MHWETIVLISVALLMIVIFIVFTVMRVQENYQLSIESELFPFSGVVGPDGQGMTLSGLDGNGNTMNQITCPSGYQVLILGAFAQPIDPYATCVPAGGPTANVFNVTCGAGTGSSAGVGQVDSTTSCTTNSDCGGGIFECNPSTHKCRLARGFTSSDACNAAGGINGSYACVNLVNGGECSTEYTGICVDTNVCLGVTYDGSSSSCQTGTPTRVTGTVNPVCAPGGQGQCAVRDASAYVAAKCNGQQSCSLTTSDFGPYPCAMTPVNCNIVPGTGTGSAYGDWTCTRVGSNQTAGNQFCELPMNYGNPGGVPSIQGQSANGSAQPGSVSLGYKFSGVYSCVA